MCTKCSFFLMIQKPKACFVGGPSSFKRFGGEANVGFGFLVVLSCYFCLVDHICCKAFLVHRACLMIPTRACAFTWDALLENFFVVSSNYFCHVGHARITKFYCMSVEYFGEGV